MAVFLLHGNATRAEQQPIRDALKKLIPELVDVDSLTAMLELAAKIKKDERSVGIVLFPLGSDLTFDQLVQFANSTPRRNIPHIDWRRTLGERL